MAKALSKSQIAASLAETVGLTKKQAVQTLEALVALAYKNAKNSFTIPGLGKIVLVNRSKTGGQVPRRQGSQGRHSGREEVTGIHIVFREGGGLILRLLIYWAGRGQVGLTEYLEDNAVALVN
jgi:nucleoid DNA-binding protein